MKDKVKKKLITIKGYLEKHLIAGVGIAAACVLIIGGILFIGLSSNNEVYNDVLVSESFTAADNSSEKYNYNIEVINDGQEKAFIRLKIDTSLPDKKEEKLLKESLNDGWQYKEGYCYYKKAIEPGETLEPAIKNIVVDDYFLIDGKYTIQVSEHKAVVKDKSLSAQRAFN